MFEYGSLSTITTLDTIISKIQQLQNKFIRLALRLPKYISAKLLHDSSGLPYMKDSLFSCATRTLERISENPLVEESITFNRVNPEKDSLFSCATRALERISKNPLVEESITFNRVNPAWNRFPTPLSVIFPVRL